MRRLFVLLSCALMSCPPVASGQVAGVAPMDPVAQLRQQGVVVARAAGELPNAKMVDYVARNAKPLDLVAPGDQSLGGRTPRQVIEQACGSLQPGYAKAFAQANTARPRPLDERIEADADKVIFPACLYARPLDATQPYRVVQGDTQTKLAERLTGYGRFDPGRLRTMFGALDNDLTINQPLPIGFVTAPTFLAPTKARADFDRELNALGNAAVADPEEGGAIIGPTDKPCEGPPEAAPGPLPPPSFADLRAAYPFNAEAVAAAYARTLAGDTPDKIYVAVLDNGFWGVPCPAGGPCPRREPTGRLAFADPFPRVLFATDLHGGDIGPILANGFKPVNYLNRLDGPVTSVSGHGTHVAGLVKGGAGLSGPTERMIFGPAGASWLKLTVGNLAPGALTFPRDAEERATLLLSRADQRSSQQVVNLSIALPDSRASNLKALIGRWSGTLFVTAAGNDGEEILADGPAPAALGGRVKRNVVTVASVDATGKLSGFSNHSKQFVDLAAPGCKVSSWLTLEQPAAVSGTSQATPLVTFTAAALYSLWPGATPDAVKARLAYSGALLAEEADRKRVRSQARLDAFQALLLRDDVVVARNPERVLLGELRPLQGLRCAGEAAPPWAKVRAFKRKGDVARLYEASAEDASAPCAGELDEMIGPATNRVFMSVRATFDDGAFKPAETAEQDFPVGDLVEFVRAELSQ